MKIYTADEIAGQLNVSKQTVLNLIKRGDLKGLPGIRHKRITEAELNRYLGVDAFTPAPAKPVCNSPATPAARPAGLETVKDKSLVVPTAKAVASPVALASRRKIK